MDRFRPNLVIAGGGVGSEDQGTDPAQRRRLRNSPGSNPASGA
jgi:uncharacterized protein YcbX